MVCVVGDWLASETCSFQSALEHRKARHVALRRMAELRGSEEAFKLKRLEYERETWEMERGLQVQIRFFAGKRVVSCES